MDFGKLSSVDLVDFRLPHEPKENESVLIGKPFTNPRLFIGPTGYNMRQWVGKWYEAGSKDREFLRQYGRQFNTIEHNTTHYRIPDTATVLRWRDETPSDFRFCPKIPQTISHSRDLGVSGREIDVFCEVIAELGTRLGCCFLQLHPAFSPEDPSWIPLAVEVRHPDFFQGGYFTDKYFAMLREQGVSAVITDVAGRRDVCHMRLTSATVLVRFVGNSLHPTDYSRVEEWSDRLRNWLENGLESAYFFTHEPDNLLAPELAAFAWQKFSAMMPDTDMRGPKEVGGQQGLLF
jgi:uncharacterized protein YecE (DUF72 family)